MSVTISMFFLQFEVTPRTKTPVSRNVAGAFVSCWIKRPTKEDAIRVAKSMIDEAGWIVGEPDEISRVTDSDYLKDSPNRQYFEQAKTDDEVLVFHTYPDLE